MSRRSELITDGFYRTCEKHPENTALIYLGEKWKYGKLRKLVDRFAAALHGLGIRRGDKIMLYIPNCPQFVICLLAAQRLGAIPVAVSPIYTPHEIKYLLEDSGAQTILCMDTNFRYVRQVYDETPLERVIVTSYTEMLPLYKRVFGLLFDKAPSGAIERGDHIHLFGKLLRNYPPEPPHVEMDPVRDLCYILYTGGTTGFPKGCIATHEGMVSFVNEVMDVGKGHISDGQDTLIMVNPLYHQLAQGMLIGLVLNKGNA
ncbi:MAG: AMP-binding protein, partial [Pseudomonadota bacterium]